jgi:glycosyltransferase involved in cell wall biosynthesis
VGVYVVPNGVDLSLFRPMDREKARQELGLALESAQILFAADPAIPRKHFALAKRSVELLRQEHPCELHAIWNRPQEQLVTWMNACDALLLPSQIEGSPNVVKEAMACNLPVVAAAVGDVAELLNRCEGNRVVTVAPEARGVGSGRGDADPIAHDFALALRDVLGRGRTRCRQAMDDLSLSAVASRLREIYERACRHRQPSPQP